MPTPSPPSNHPGSTGAGLQQKDSQESSPTPQFKSINSLVFRLLYGLLGIQGDSKVGTESASLEITYLITDREGLEN